MSTDLVTQRLAEQEAVIARGLGTFMDVGLALSTIRDDRLYLQTHDNFEGYCRDRWGMTDRRARQMIDAAQTVGALPAGTTVPVTESQARELSGLDPEAAADVMRKADVATDGKPTASAIRDARTPEPITGTDGKTYTRPESDPISAAVAEAKASPDVLGSTAITHLEKAHAWIVRAGGPEAICASNDTNPLGAWNRERWADLLDRITPLIDAWAEQLADRSKLRSVK